MVHMHVAELVRSSYNLWGCMMSLMDPDQVEIRDFLIVNLNPLF
jgi:hypothetical protein